MKRLLYLVLCLAMAGLLFAESNSSKIHAFTSTDADAVLEVERKGTEVMLHLLVKNMSQYDHIIVERSPDGGTYFGQCKYITCADEKPVNGYLMKVDKYPLPGVKSSYYRIKTVTKDGITRAYPAVTLLAVSK